MGTPWDEHPAANEREPADGPGPVVNRPGLGADELDLLRNAPDYDAEEMATVRPAGGWPTPSVAPAPEPVRPVADPPLPAWTPPNRVEVPCAPAISAAVPEPPAAVSPRSRFPEERTLALLAEDLLGRPLDEPARPKGSPADSSFEPGGASERRTAGSSDVWEMAMPLLAEG